jgi:isoleucyl-tRNA synthetase
MFAKLIAPFLPFLAETVHGALGGQNSVHLQDWPQPRLDWRNEEASRSMGVVRKIVYLVRRIREERNIKHRVPLRSVQISGIIQDVLETNFDLLHDELNVKEIHRLERTEAVVAPVIKLNYPALGARLRGDVKLVASALQAGQYELLNQGATLRVAGFNLTGDDFSIRFEPKDQDTGVAVDGGIIVVLDLRLDPSLIAEGTARALNRRLQELRKKAGLAYSDRIVVSVVGSDAIRAVVRQHNAWLKEQLLATSIFEQPLEDALASEQAEVDDYAVTISLKKNDAH